MSFCSFINFFFWKKKHLAADLHVTGEAKYVDDITPLTNTLYAHYVLSSRSHAKILSIDISEAEKVQGFVDYVSSKDIKGEKNVGVFHDEKLFEDDIVQSFGIPIALIVAKTPNAAKEAAKKVKIEYQDLPPIYTIEEAIKEE